MIPLYNVCPFILPQYETPKPKMKTMVVFLLLERLAQCIAQNRSKSLKMTVTRESQLLSRR
jgi:hypothetical protein